MQSRLNLLLVVTVFAVPLAGPARACFMRSPQPVQVWLDHIDVEITDQVAVKTYNCTFLNPNPQAVVGGTCYMELEPGARVQNMTVVVNGKQSRAEILEVKRANEVFQQMVKEGHSPALLEYYGNQLIQTKVPRIAPGGTVNVKLSYTMLLEKKGDLVRLQMLNTNPKAEMKPLKSASVRVAIRSQEPLKNVYSPTHAINVEEDPDWDVVVKWSQEDYLPTHPFVLYYQLARQRVGASLLAHRELGEEGHFMLMLSPTIGRGAGAVTEEQILPKDVVFCVDTSGSMVQGKKLQQARGALDYCLKQLREGDRFNIVDFGTGVRRMERAGLVPATDENRARALRYVENLAPRGGTAIDEALESSVELLGESDRLKMILFATDGLPTIGERSPEGILANMDKRNTRDVRLFVFGEGFDVNTKLLDLLALGHRGESEYILPEEDITKKIAGFFDRVGSPVMTDLEVSFDGLDVEEVFPRKIPDIYKGEQVVLYGRFDGSGRKTVNLRGKVNGKVETLSFELDFPEYSENDKNAFVPRLWAGQKVDFLLNELRKSGSEDEELIQEITFLAKRHGIVTPFTSFLMVEENCNLPMDRQVANFRSELRGRPGALLEKNEGYAAVNNAKLQARNRGNLHSQGAAAGLYLQVADGLAQVQRGGQALAAVRYVGNRTFYNSRGVWYDSRYDDEQKEKVQDVEVGSQKYLDLLRDQPRSAQYLAQGKVVVNLRGQWYRFNERRR